MGLGVSHASLVKWLPRPNPKMDGKSWQVDRVDFRPPDFEPSFTLSLFEQTIQRAAMQTDTFITFVIKKMLFQLQAFPFLPFRTTASCNRCKK